ncbi:MAG TPA: biotin--[acetyl-CoA-carboxylase] ligase, partial [Actinomycetota bacterium]
MVTVDLERALHLADLAAPVRWDEVTGSTNATAMELAAAGTPEWTLVAAGHQRDGRGRLGRAWLDHPGDSLMVSVVLRPALSADDAGVLTLWAGAAWAEASSALTGLQVRCKWPNDLLVDGRKVGGILAESAGGTGPDAPVAHVVIGSGINLVAPPEIEG